MLLGRREWIEHAVSHAVRGEQRTNLRAGRLPENVVRQLRDVQMDARHARLDALMDDEKKVSAR
jgi:ParB-like chromosome segregation protein Spo0J